MVDKWRRWLPALVLALAALTWPALTGATRTEVTPCDPALACFDVFLTPATLLGDFYLDGTLVAAGVNSARLVGAPDTPHLIEVKNIQDPVTPGWNDLFLYPDLSRPNISTRAGRVLTYTLEPTPSYVKGILALTCDPRGRAATDILACRPTIDGVPQPDLAPGAIGSYNLTAGAHAVHTELVGDQSVNWSPTVRDDTVTMYAGRSYALKTSLRASFTLKGLMKITLSATGVVGDLYIDGVLVAPQAAAANVYVAGGNHTVEAKAINDSTANGQWVYPDVSLATSVRAAGIRNARLRLVKNWLVGYLNVTCTISRKTATDDVNCGVTADGVPLGTVAAAQSAVFNLAPGAHAISVATGGAQAGLWDGPVSRNLTVYGGRTSYFSARFSKKPQPAVVLPSTPPGINHMGTEKVVLADYFMFWAPSTFNTNIMWDTPASGPYDSKDFGTIQRQVAQAQQACLNGFLAHWLGSNEPYTTNTFNQLLAASGGTNLRHAIVLTQNSQPGATEQALIDSINYLIGNWGQHPNYLRLGGRPVIVFTDMPRPWGNDNDALAAWTRIRAATDPNHNTIWMAEGLTTLYNPLFDGLYVYRIDHRDYPQAWLKQPRWASNLRQVEARGGLPIGGLYFADSIAPGFDDTRSANLTNDTRAFAPHFARDRRNGGYYADTFSVTSQTGGDMLFVKSFNEWIEGTEIEPGTSYGDLYLNLTCQYANTYRSR